MRQNFRLNNISKTNFRDHSIFNKWRCDVSIYSESNTRSSDSNGIWSFTWLVVLSVVVTMVVIVALVETIVVQASMLLRQFLRYISVYFEKFKSTYRAVSDTNYTERWTDRLASLCENHHLNGIWIFWRRKYV